MGGTKHGFARILGILGVGIAVALAGCGGGDTEVRQQTNTTTMGQELMDLNKSYEAGIISEQEYKRAKKAILKRYE